MIAYRTGDPQEKGVFACRVKLLPADLPEDKFLVRMDGKWWYQWSDQEYRGEVLGWVGPLERKVRTNEDRPRKD